MYNALRLGNKALASRNAIYSFTSIAILLTMTASAQASSPTDATLTQSNSPEYVLNHCNSDIQAYPSKSISSRQETIGCMITQLQAYQHSHMSARQQYFAYKAQAWLNYANHERSIKSRSSAGTHAFSSGAAILHALKNGNEKNLELTADIPSTSALMRPDLWATLQALKEEGGIVSAPRELAFSEVALIWAAANQCEHGWRQSSAHFRMADRWLEQAREAYVNAHNSQDNVTLIELINRYYKQYAPLDPSDDSCQGQALSVNLQTSTSTLSESSITHKGMTIPMPIPSATYTIDY